MTSPPLGATLDPGRLCARVVAGRFGVSGEEVLCLEPGVRHFLWDRTMENGMTCQRHADEAIERGWGIDSHPMNDVCAMPGIVWVFGDPSTCCFDGIETVAERVETKVHERAPLRQPLDRGHEAHGLREHRGAALAALIVQLGPVWMADTLRRLGAHEGPEGWLIDGHWWLSLEQAWSTALGLGTEA